MKRIISAVLAVSFLLILVSCTENKESLTNSGNIIYLPQKANETTVYNSDRGDTDVSFKFEYDSYGNLILEEKYYKRRTFFITTEEIYSRKTTKYTYDDKGLVISSESLGEYFGEEPYSVINKYEYVYNDKGLLAEKIYLQSANTDNTGKRRYLYEYDEHNRLIKEVFSRGEETDGIVSEYNYNNDGRVSKKVSIELETETVSEYYYSEKGLLTDIKETYYDRNGEIYYDQHTNYGYDSIGRKIKETVIYKHRRDTNNYQKEITYGDFEAINLPTV